MPSAVGVLGPFHRQPGSWYPAVLELRARGPEVGGLSRPAVAPTVATLSKELRTDQMSPGPTGLGSVPAVHLDQALRRKVHVAHAHRDHAAGLAEGARAPIGKLRVLMHPVAQVLHERRASASRPGARQDGHRVGLAVEGGAMRGVVSAGMLVALEELGYRDAFDVVYGSSAGSLNAAYFIAGQAWFGLPLYMDQAADGAVVRWRRALRGQAVVSLECVLDVLMARHAPLDWEAVLASPIELCVLASSVTEARPVSLTRFVGPGELRQALRAGAAIPFLAGPPVEFRGRLLVDAAVTLAHPYEAAVAEHCTHVLSLSTRARGRLAGPPGLAARFQAWQMDRLGPGLGAASLRRQAGYREAQLRLAALTERPGQPPLVLDVALAPDSPQVPRLTRDAGRLLQGARLGYEAAVAAVEQRTARAVLRLTEMTFEDT